MARMDAEIRLSQSATEFLAATLDLVQAIDNADPMLVTDEILAARRELSDVIARHRGQL